MRNRHRSACSRFGPQPSSQPSRFLPGAIPVTRTSSPPTTVGSSPVPNSTRTSSLWTCEGSAPTPRSRPRRACGSCSENSPPPASWPAEHWAGTPDGRRIQRHSPGPLSGGLLPAADRQAQPRGDRGGGSRGLRGTPRISVHPAREHPLPARLPPSRPPRPRRASFARTTGPRRGRGGKALRRTGGSVLGVRQSTKRRHRGAGVTSVGWKRTSRNRSSGSPQTLLRR